MDNKDARCQACRASQASPPCFGCWIGSAEEKKCKEDVYRASKQFSKEQIYHGVCSSRLNKEAQKDYNAMLSVMAEAVRVDREARERQAGEIFWVDTYEEEQRKKQVTKDEALLKSHEENGELKAEIRRLKSLAKSNKFFVEKRQEDLMNYQDKQNEEIESLRKKLSELSGPVNDPNFWKKASALFVANEDIKNLKSENKTLRKKARQILDSNKFLKKRNEKLPRCTSCRHNASSYISNACIECGIATSNWEAK